MSLELNPVFEGSGLQLGPVFDVTGVPTIGTIVSGDTTLTIPYTGAVTHYRVYALGSGAPAWISAPPSPIVFTGTSNTEYQVEVSGDGSTVADSEQAGTNNPGTGGGEFVIPAEGELVGGGAAIVGSATRFRAFEASGALSGGGAAVAGTASRFRQLVASGALVAGGATLSGAAARTAIHTAVGALAGGGGSLSGTADHIVPGGTHTAVGALLGGGAAVAGTAVLRRLHTATGLLVGGGALVAGTAARTAGLVTHTASGALAGGGAAIVADASLPNRQPPTVPSGGGGYAQAKPSPRARLLKLDQERNDAELAEVRDIIMALAAAGVFD